MDPYLLGLRLEGRRVVVVGGGAVASRRVPALLDAGAHPLLGAPQGPPPPGDPARRGGRPGPRRAGSAGRGAATGPATAPGPGWSARVPTTPRSTRPSRPRPR